MPVLLPVGTGQHCLFVSFTQGDGIALSPLTLIEGQGMNQVKETLVIGHPLRELHSSDFLTNPEVEEKDVVLSITLPDYLGTIAKENRPFSQGQKLAKQVSIPQAGHCLTFPL